jgi:hypothetical protein
MSFSVGRREEHAISSPKSTLLAGGSDGLQFVARCFETENCFAFFHQIKAIARNCFQVADVCLKQVDLPSLPRQQSLLVADLLLEVVNFRAALHQFFVWRHKEAHDHQPDRDDEQNDQNPVQSLPDGGFATRAKFSVTMLHFGGL